MALNMSDSTFSPYAMALTLCDARPSFKALSRTNSVTFTCVFDRDLNLWRMKIIEREKHDPGAVSLNMRDNTK